MKIIHPDPNDYKRHLGERRVITWYALFPVRIGNEERWLETVSVEQEYREAMEISEDGVGPARIYGHWENLRFKN